MAVTDSQQAGANYLTVTIHDAEGRVIGNATHGEVIAAIADEIIEEDASLSFLTRPRTAAISTATFALARLLDAARQAPSQMTKPLSSLDRQLST